MTILDFNKALTQQEAEARARAGRLDAEDIKQRINSQAREFVQWLFQGRAHCTAREARIGDVQGKPGASLSIALTGRDAGLWHDHATGEGGDLIALYGAHMSYQNGQNFQLALKEIAADFLKMPVQVERTAWQPSVAERLAEKREKLGSTPRADLLELGAPVASWKYYDTRGNVLASVLRYEPDGTPESKTYRPWCHKTIDGKLKWMPGAPEMRPLFRLPEIATVPDVVLVEGEKCAEALAALGIEATTAMQGCKAPIEKTDWSPLHRKNVTIWPDADPGGLEYAQRVAARLVAIGCTVRIVQPPAGKPLGWDVADLIAEHGDPVALLRQATLFDQPAKPFIRVLDIDDLEDLKPPEWLIDGILPEHGLGILWGQSGDLKSFVALDMALCIATGHPWHGKAVQEGLVFFVAAEGATGLASRVIGWRRTKGKTLSKPRFKLIPQAVALASAELELLVQAILDFGQTPRLIIIDTLARTFGAGDENKQADMNAYVNAADKLRIATGAAVLIIHHSGVHEDKRERGSNVLRGAADTVIKVKRNDQKISVINRAPEGKQKDAEEFETIKLRSQKVAYESGENEFSTLILMSDTDPLPEGEGDGFEEKLPTFGKVEKLILRALKKAEQPLGATRLIAMTRQDESAIYKALKNLAAKNAIQKLPENGAGPALWEVVACNR